MNCSFTWTGLLITLATGGILVCNLRMVTINWNHKGGKSSALLKEDIILEIGV